MVIRHLVQLLDESVTAGILGAVEDALEDGLVLGIDVVVLQQPEDMRKKQPTETSITSNMVGVANARAKKQQQTSNI